MTFNPNPQNTDELLGLIKGIIWFDKYTFDSSLYPSFTITQKGDEFLIDYQWSDHTDKYGEPNECKDSFTVNFKTDPLASVRFIVAMLDDLYNIEVKVDKQVPY